MLNMVMAIIMDVYTEVRAQGSDSETVSESFWYIALRLRGWRQWVLNEDVLARLKKLPEVSTFQEVREVFPDMTNIQFEWLKAKVLKRTQINSRIGEHTEKLFVHMVAGLNLGLSLAKTSLQRIEMLEEDENGVDR